MIIKDRGVGEYEVRIGVWRRTGEEVGVVLFFGKIQKKLVFLLEDGGGGRKNKKFKKIKDA